jgi:hypothetical protein
MDGKQLIREYENGRAARANFERRWDFMAPYLSPSRVGILSKRSVGVDQMEGIYDATSIGAADLLAKFICGHTINPGQSWGKVRPQKEPGAERDDEEDWADETSDRVLKALGNSNFYAEAPEMANDYVALGTGCLYGDERKEYRSDYEERRRGFRGLRFCADKTGRFTIFEDAEGRVDKNYRETQYSARAAGDKFGLERLSDKLKQLYGTEKQEELFTFIHCVRPRDKALRGREGAKGYSWASYWIEKETQQIVSEGGYKWYPFNNPRWEKTPGEIYGRGPGDRAFPDTRTLNKIKELELQDLALKVRPAFLQANDAVVGPVRLRPAGPTVVKIRGNQSVRDVIAPWETGSKPEVTQLKEEQLRQAIERLFFVDLLRKLMETEKSEMTAYEYAEKLRLLYQLLGSVYGRWESEFLAPTFENTLNLMWDAGALSDPPDSLLLRSGTLLVEFTSPLALAQKSQDIDAIRLTFADLAGLALNDPQKLIDLIDNYDQDKAARIVGKLRGMPESVIRSEMERDKIRRARTDSRLQDEKLQQMLQLSEASKNAAPFLKAVQQPAQNAA